MKKILYYLFIILPNIPFILIISLYLLFRILRSTPLYDIIIYGDDLIDGKFKDYMASIYPNYLKKAIALVFWLFITVNYIL